ncbi:Hypothetical protein CINCED_3A007932 [Cinara cedri]|uniref:Reverse transcriptase domain n=1 Tax=Cinara cedri TaxID=506608 RepID=A0A5E4MEC5_9HEMI|nr:Hypothetical protein CINCED_3A007932 [Cinara cedri]
MQHPVIIDDQYISNIVLNRSIEIIKYGDIPCQTVSLMTLIPTSKTLRDDLLIYKPLCEFRIVTIEKLVSTSTIIPTGKTSGLDGFPDLVFKALVTKKLATLLGLFNFCITLVEGVFPSTWKSE